jgi:uncharacterized repeat protein (TIGR01451 family)
MTVAAQAEPWWTRTVSLASLAGQTVTLTIQTNHITRFRSWFHIDDVEWSVVNGTLGAPQGFGLVFLTPTAATAGITPLSISVQVDANPTAGSSPVTVDLVNPGGSVTRTVPLFNDGTHGDAVAGDAIWTNNGSVAADRMVLPGGALNGSWRLRAYARDASTSTIGARNGVIRGPGTGAAPETEANYWNIEELMLGAGALSVTKTSSVVSDPFNGTTNPKRIPGSTIQYCVVVTNTGSGAVTSIVLSDTINLPEIYVAGSIRSGTSCANAVLVEDDNNTGADESDPVGASFGASTVTGRTATIAAGASVAFVYNITVQ